MAIRADNSRLANRASSETNVTPASHGKCAGTFGDFLQKVKLEVELEILMILAKLEEFSTYTYLWHQTILPPKRVRSTEIPQKGCPLCHGSLVFSDFSRQRGFSYESPCQSPLVGWDQNVWKLHLNLMNGFRGQDSEFSDRNLLGMCQNGG